MRYTAIAMALFSMLYSPPIALAQGDAATSGTDAILAAFDYRCTDITGTSISAPDWNTVPDGAAGQELIIRYGGNQEISRVSWTRDGQTYYEAVGLGMALRTGFAIAVFAEDFVETYVYSLAAAELLYSSTRSGSAFPDIIKAFRGVCEPVAR